MLRMGPSSNSSEASVLALASPIPGTCEGAQSEKMAERRHKWEDWYLGQIAGDGRPQPLSQLVLIDLSLTRVVLLSSDLFRHRRYDSVESRGG